MTETKKALKQESLCKFNDNIITSNDNYSNMPAILRDIFTLYKSKYINLSDKFILNILISKTAQMLTGKRTTLNEAGKINIPNWYSINFIPSGYGKDRLVNDLDCNIFSDYRAWFKEQAKKYYQTEIEHIKQTAEEKYTGTKQEKVKAAFIEKEIEKIRNIVIEIQDGTQEGFYADCKAFSKAPFGSAYIKISELGLYLKSLSNEKLQFINCLYNAYDGVINSKCIKGGVRENQIENLPVNALLYSDYTLFQGDIKAMFTSLISTGLGRRALISFQAPDALQDECMTANDEQIFYSNAQEYGKNLFSIFYNLPSNACYVLDADAKDNVLNAYKRELIDKFNNTDNELLKKEIKSRELKALKLSCIYACLNHPQKFVISKEDVKQAIATIEFLSTDFERVINYKPKTNDFYDRLFNFILENQDKEEITKYKLTYKYFQQLGISRRKFLITFDEAIEIVKEIAKSNDYALIEQSINNNTGIKYYLQPVITNNDNNIISFDEVIKNKK